MNDYLFFKGCTIPVKFPYLEKLALALLPSIGINLDESTQFSCCPDPIQVQGVNQTFWYATAARNIAIAEEQDKNILTLCNGCLNTLAVVNFKLKHNAALKDKINTILLETGHQYHGTIEVKHLMQVIKDDVGINSLKDQISVPLTQLKIAGHPGCHLLNPSTILKFDDPFDPTVYDQFIEALGAIRIDYLSKIDCCGVSLSLSGATSAANQLLKKKLCEIKARGAQLVSTPCPFCFQQFDTGQLLAGRTIPEIKQLNLPVLHALELLGLAMGKGIDEIGYNTHKIHPPLEIQG